MQVLVLGTYPVFQHVLQLEGIVAELLTGHLRILAVVFEHDFLHARLNGDILVGAGTVFDTFPRDGHGG